MNSTLLHAAIACAELVLSEKHLDLLRYVGNSVELLSTS